MDELIAEYINEHKFELGKLYKWDFDLEIPQKKFGITLNGTTWLEKTTELKDFLCKRIASCSSFKNHEEIAEYFIKEWGGIKRFSQTKKVVEQFRRIAGTETVPNDFKQKFESISSWSKWASLVCPKWACIYDARVAYSINAINYINGGQHKIFPMPNGRNSHLNILDVSTLLLSAKIQVGDESDAKAIRKKYFVPEAFAYREYLTIVRGVSARIWQNHEHIHEVEMLLFSLADKDVYKSVFSSLQRHGATANCQHRLTEDTPMRTCLRR